MKSETFDALDMFVQTVTRAIRVAIPEATETVKDVEQAALELRERLGEEEVS